VPIDAQIRVEISNATTVDSSIGKLDQINFYGLNVEGQNGQSTSNYVSNIVDEKSFNNITNGFSGNATFKSGLKSVAIVMGATAHVKIVAIT